MKIRESSLWHWLKANAPADCIMERVENSVSANTPDVIGVWRGRSFSIELKTAKAGVEPGLALLSAGQRRRMEKWNAAGGNCWALIQIGGGRNAARHLITTGYITSPNEENIYDDVNSFDTLITIITQ